jgi:hypothetical protein
MCDADSSDSVQDGGSGELNNPINAAAYSGSVDMLRLMLRHFEDRSLEWRDDRSVILTRALLTAITQSPENQQILTKLLLEYGARIQYQTSELLPKLPLEAAVTRGLISVVNYLLQTRDANGQFADTLAESGIRTCLFLYYFAISSYGCSGAEELPREQQTDKLRLHMSQLLTSPLFFAFDSADLL